MAIEDTVLNAYHKAARRYQERTGISYPLTRSNCVSGEGTVTDTDVYEPCVVARWTRDSLGQIRIKLV